MFVLEKRGDICDVMIVAWNNNIDQQSSCVEKRLIQTLKEFYDPSLVVRLPMGSVCNTLVPGTRNLKNY